MIQSKSTDLSRRHVVWLRNKLGADPMPIRAVYGAVALCVRHSDIIDDTRTLTDSERELEADKDIRGMDLLSTMSVSSIQGACL